MDQTLYRHSAPMELGANVEEKLALFVIKEVTPTFAVSLTLVTG